MNRNVNAAILLIFVLSAIGCGGPGETIINSEKMTAEQIEQMAADDLSVEDEESKGAMAKQRAKKK